MCKVCHRWARSPICADCVNRLATPAAPYAAPPLQQHTARIADDGFPWIALIAGFKFRGQPELAIAFAELNADAVRAAVQGLPALVLPLPLAPRLLAERGCDQAWADVLRRSRDTANQTDLPRAKRRTCCSTPARSRSGSSRAQPRIERCSTSSSSTPRSRRTPAT